MPSRITAYEKKRKRNQRIGLIGGIVLLVLVMAWFGWSQVRPAAERQQTDEVFKKALQERDRKTFQELVYLNNKPLQMADSNRLMDWFLADPQRLDRAVAEITSDQKKYPQKTKKTAEQDLFALKKQAGRFWYDTYILHLNKQTLEVTSDTEGTEISIEDAPVGNLNQEKPLTIERFPGEYEVSARVEANGKTGRASKIVQLGDQKTTAIAFQLAEQVAPDQKEQYGIDIEKLLEAEVKARTGKTVEQITDYIGQSQKEVEQTFGPPSTRVANKTTYDGFEVTYDKQEVQSLLIDLNKTPSELEAVAGKPQSKAKESVGTVWKYPANFFEELLGWLNIKSEKRVIERSGKMWLELR
ncbi:hypothetical protein QK289_11360 [Exiguobacterium antarcticum]|uniref:TcaA second domain-containing protein n=1 Tax=Exiguobacterium antarcticum TaxID=132920 RepID=A0ABT6R5Q2_9BACL|nr:hypothetical protein [Exiguobacterium antarcticum]MDI3235604.1 hypothetical protein [Exiguobacterium antarcticum]